MKLEDLEWAAELRRELEGLVSARATLEAIASAEAGKYARLTATVEAIPAAARRYREFLDLMPIVPDTAQVAFNQVECKIVVPVLLRVLWDRERDVRADLIALGVDAGEGGDDG